VGVFTYSIVCKKLIESPLSHGTNVPCCHNDVLTGEEIFTEHDWNIGELKSGVKKYLFLFKARDAHDPAALHPAA
jgi:hypothetical protein